MNATGLVTKIFDKIISASQTERFTQDFLKTKLGYDSGSSRPFIPLLKRLGLHSTDVVSLQPPCGSTTKQLYCSSVDGGLSGV
jgi:Family of unknown function (DUF5343)